MDLGTSSLDHPALPLEDDVIWTDTERFAMLAARTAVADSAPGIGPGESVVPRSGEIALVVESALSPIEIRWL